MVGSMMQIVKAMIVVLPAIFPNIAFFFQLRKGNPYCWFWLAGGLVMASGLALTLKHYGLEKLQDL
jgi:hypothetical protein